MQYDKIKFVKIEDVSDFWRLYDELSSDMSGPRFPHETIRHNRRSLVGNFKDGTLFGLRIIESEEMFKSKDRGNDCFARSKTEGLSFYLLPCFITVVNGTIQLLWVHPRIRKQGYGTKLVKLSGASKVSKLLPDYGGREVEPFWTKIGF